MSASDFNRFPESPFVDETKIQSRRPSICEQDGTCGNPDWNHSWFVITGDFIKQPIFVLICEQINETFNDFFSRRIHFGGVTGWNSQFQIVSSVKVFQPTCKFQFQRSNRFSAFTQWHTSFAPFTLTQYQPSFLGLLVHFDLLISSGLSPSIPWRTLCKHQNTYCRFLHTFYLESPKT